MTAAFVPLVAGQLPSVTRGATTRLKPISAEPAPFQPATVANPPSIVKSQAEPPPAPSPVPHVQHGPPKVTVEREGETITHIRIECGCGQVTEIKCEY
jgi:hypothetical protein